MLCVFYFLKNNFQREFRNLQTFVKGKWLNMVVMNEKSNVGWVVGNKNEKYSYKSDLRQNAKNNSTFRLPVIEEVSVWFFKC